MKFVTMFPSAENIHLIKDVGMIPYIMHKKFGYKSELACYKNGEYPFINVEVKGLELKFIKKYTGKAVIDGALYLLKSSKKIDVLHLFHFGKRDIIWIWIYTLLNREGKIYLKLDADNTIKKTVNPCDNSLKAKIKKYTLKRCKLITVETLNIYNFLIDNWKIAIEYLPNGFYDYGKKEPINYENKINTILTVGRIGTFQKATEVLLEGFKCAANKIENWKLKVVGPIEKDFEVYIKDFMKSNPELRERIEFTGAIYDRVKLEEEYKKAKIFCLTSRYEGFPLVFLEAIKHGCYIISTNFNAAYDITNNEKYGMIFDIDNSKQLSDSLVKACNNEMTIKQNFHETNKFCYENFYWPVLCKQICDFLDE
ncbi:MAG: glycosyltransferase family 4 protein [Clostridia bacterium]